MGCAEGCDTASGDSPPGLRGAAGSAETMATGGADEPATAGGEATGLSGGVALVSGAIFIGRSALGGSGAVTEAAALTRCWGKQPAVHSERPARKTIKPARTFDRVGIHRFPAANGGRSPQLRNGFVGNPSQGQVDTKRGAAPEFGFEFYLSIVQLYKSKCVRQADPVPPGRVVKKLKNFLLVFGRDSFSGVLYFDGGEIAGATQIDGNCAVES